MAAAPPAVPEAPPAQPALVTEHTNLDAVQNRIASALAKARPNTPVVPPLADAPITGPTTTPVAPEPVPPAAAPVEAPEVNLEAIDFDAPPEPEKPATPELPDAVATEPKTPEADLVKQLAETLTKGDIPAKVEEVFLKTARGRQMLTSFKTLRDLAQPPDKGGIGRVPTMDEIKAADLAARDLMAMRFDFENNPVSFAANLFRLNPETGSSYFGEPAKVQQVLETIPQVLFQAIQESANNPVQKPIYENLYLAYSAPVFSNFFNHQYTQAMAMPQETPEQIAQYRAANQEPPLLTDKIRLLDALQISEFKAFGKARPLNWNPIQTNGAAAPDLEKQQLLERLRQAEAQVNSSRTAQQQAIAGTIESSGKSSAMADIGTVLKQTGVDKIYPTSVVTSQQEVIYQELKAALPAHDPGGWQAYLIQLQQAQRGQIDPEVAAKSYRRLFQNAIRTSPAVRERLNDLVKGAKAHVDAQHATRQQSQLRTEPDGTGIPAPSSVVPSQQLARQPGESIEDYNTRRILAASQRVKQAPAR